MRRRVNAGRASTRRSVQIVMGITVVFVLGLTAVQPRATSSPTPTPVGQVVLLRDPRPVRRRVRLDAPAGRLRGARSGSCSSDQPDAGREVRRMTAVMLVGAVRRARRAAARAAVRHRPRPAAPPSSPALDAARRADPRARPCCTADEREQRESLRDAPARRASSAPCFEARGWNLPAGVRADLAVMGGTVEGHLGMSVLAARRRAVRADGDVRARRSTSSAPSVSAPRLAGRCSARSSARLLPTLQLQGTRQGAAARLPPRGQLVPRPGLDEPRRRPRRARGAAVRGQPQQRLGDGADPRDPRRTPGCRASPRGRRSASSARRWRSRSCATSPPRWPWSPRTAPRCASRWRPGPPRCASASWPTPRAGPPQRSQSMLIAQLLLCVGFLLFLIYPPISEILGF